MLLEIYPDMTIPFLDITNVMNRHTQPVQYQARMTILGVRKPRNVTRKIKAMALAVMVNGPDSSRSYTTIHRKIFIVHTESISRPMDVHLWLIVPEQRSLVTRSYITPAI